MSTMGAAVNTDEASLTRPPLNPALPNGWTVAQGSGPLVENMLYVGLLQAQLKRLCILLLLDEWFYNCHLGQAGYCAVQILDILTIGLPVMLLIKTEY